MSIRRLPVIAMPSAAPLPAYLHFDTESLCEAVDAIDAACLVMPLAEREPVA